MEPRGKRRRVHYRAHHRYYFSQPERTVWSVIEVETSLTGAEIDRDLWISPLLIATTSGIRGM
jgi:hypothetical protein